MRAGVIAAAALLMAACTNNDDKVIEAAVADLNSPQNMQAMLSVPGIERFDASYRGDSLSIDVTYSSSLTDGLPQDSIANMFVELYRQPEMMNQQLVDALNNRHVNIILHLTSQTTATTTRVLIPPSSLR